MNILIIEDDEEKLNRVRAFLAEQFSDSSLSAARSLASGLRAVIARNSELDLILLDMSMHNFDVSADEPGGGNPEPFAGRELLAQMKLRGLFTPVIIVTMFDSFGDDHSRVSLEQLGNELFANYSPPFVAVVHYDARREGWQSALRLEMDKIKGEKK